MFNDEQVDKNTKIVLDDIKKYNLPNTYASFMEQCVAHDFIDLISVITDILINHDNDWIIDSYDNKHLEDIKNKYFGGDFIEFFNFLDTSEASFNIPKDYVANGGFAYIIINRSKHYVSTGMSRTDLSKDLRAYASYLFKMIEASDSAYKHDNHRDYYVYSDIGKRLTMFNFLGAE